eukprot:10173428-Lingulodinium_polyedra.AAC.1
MCLRRSEPQLPLRVLLRPLFVGLASSLRGSALFRPGVCVASGVLAAPPPARGRIWSCGARLRWSAAQR